ncbi:O-succinylbenzoate synthase [Bowdeniella nasicola]|uniref:O-succinylbenzoate synthase n=1 Tax=Bowdeniella nasicola TaxID=208480 RepID=A0A1Q5Q283_9ACTO|nr:o-succinylbenzoate synthase [Bowdeniella nasicola]OKL53951.1 O-succinylbenzoate synthase [Bowdeniella nasicola]
MIRVYSTPLRARFRGLTRRTGIILTHGQRAAEFSPFIEYDDAYAARWLKATTSALLTDVPPGRRQTINVNVTVPAVSPERAHEIVLASGGCRTAKVKVADAGQDLADDLARLEAVRDALGPTGLIRVDANTGWDLEDAIRILPQLDRAAGGLQYAEQPVADVEDLATLRRQVNVPIAADESIRRSDDPLAVARLAAADYAILKVQPLGGIRAAMDLADALSLPVVASSALESSVGIALGVQLAAALDIELACGLATVHLFAHDVTSAPLLPTGGTLPVRAVTPDRLLAGDPHLRCEPDEEAYWLARLERVAALAGIDLDAFKDEPHV